MTDKAVTQTSVSMSGPGAAGPVCRRKTSAIVEAGTQKRYFRPLSKEFRHDGFSHRQIAREGDAAIYEQRWTGCPESSVTYEVVRVRWRDGFQIRGRFIEAAEVYPRSEQWGELGWTVPDKETAFCKLREIVNSRKKNRRIP